MGKHWGFYANLRDNNETKEFQNQRILRNDPEGPINIPMTEEEITARCGEVLPIHGSGVPWFSEADHNQWGNNYHGPMIMTDRAFFLCTDKVENETGKMV
ncbi:MAG: hypothetical protein R2750_12010 [Bacteroidales bacterium]